MEVLSLALLAAASGGLLLKARGHSKKEGFSDPNLWINKQNNEHNPLFSKSIEAQGQQNQDFNKHLNFVERTTTRYNPFAGIFNPLNPSPQDAPDNDTIKNILRSYNTTPDSNAFYTYDSNTSDKNLSAYGVIPNKIGSNINYCENIKIPTLSDNISKDCSVFSDSNFNNYCGICHGKGTNSGNLNITDPLRGLYITGDTNTRDEQQKYSNSNNLKYNKPPSFINWKPTIGTCEENTNNVVLNNFSVDSNTCVLTNNINLCSARGAAALGSNGCYQCLVDNKYYYVRPTISTQRTIIQLKGSGICTLKIDNKNYTPSGSSTSFVLENKMQTITIPLDSDGNTADGKTLNITVERVNDTPAYVQGYFVGNIRTNTTINTSDSDNRDIAITAYDITSGKSIRPNYEDGQPTILKQYLNMNNLILSILIPYAYIDTDSVESMNCQGPYIRSPEVAKDLGAGSCFIHGSNTPGNYDISCLQDIFTSAGCTSNGSGFPNDSNTKENLLTSNGTNRTLGQISQFVVSEYFKALNGTEINGNNIDVNIWNSKYKFCIDKNKDVTNVCDFLPSNIKENGPVPLRCIQHIFNDGSNDKNPYGTYDRTMYGNAKSLWSGSLKDRFCTSNGYMAPTASNLKLLQYIKPDGSSNRSYVGIDSIKQFYRNIHKQANQQSLTNFQREVYVKQCYDSNYSLQSDGIFDPTITLGATTATTNCGTKAKYIKLTGANISDENQNPYVKISQLIAIDARGQNVALKKKPSYSSLYTGTSAEAPLDGVYENRNRANIFVSAGTGPTEWYKIDLGGLYDIVQVIYYNRESCDGCQLTANGMKLELFDENNVIVGTSILTNALVQYINFKSDNAPCYCPKTFTGLRGNVIDPPAVIHQSKPNIGLKPSSKVYTLYNSLPNSATDANWIWNDPYATFSDKPVTFYTIINNPSYQPIPYTLNYAIKSGTLTNITVNNAILSPTINNVEVAPQSGFATFSINPGDNYIEATVSNVNNMSNGFQAVLSNSKTHQYENPTNTSNWNTITTPSNNFSNTPTNIKLYNVGGSNIWNQPNASINAGGEGMDFNLNLPVSGTSILTYSIVYSVNSTEYKVIITVNKIVIINNEKSSPSWTTKTFDVVPGVNSIKVELVGGTGPAGFAAYIKDNTGASINPTNAPSSGWYTTTTTIYNCKNACAHLSATDSNLPIACLTTIWNDNNCSGNLPDSNYNSYTMSGFSNMVYRDYASSTAPPDNKLVCSGAIKTRRRNIEPTYHHDAPLSNLDAAIQNPPL